MSFYEQRVYIKARTALNQSAIDIHNDLNKIHGESSFAYSTVAKWASRLKDGRD